MLLQQTILDICFPLLQGMMFAMTIWTTLHQGEGEGGGGGGWNNWWASAVTKSFDLQSRVVRVTGNPGCFQAHRCIFTDFLFSLLTHVISNMLVNNISGVPEGHLERCNMLTKNSILESGWVSFFKILFFLGWHKVMKLKFQGIGDFLRMSPKKIGMTI